MNRIIYYYQTFNGLDEILKPNPVVTHINVSSIHFGKNPDNSPYIHLNNNSPDDPVFDNLWEQLVKACQLGIKIHLMVGGAGGAYNDLFNNYDVYYPMLINTIKKYSIITGIDLDIEEPVLIDNVKKLINNLVKDLGNDFEITMAPILSSLETNNPGMGGFIYKDLYNSDEGKLIKYFHVQCYDSFQFQNFQNMVKNGYPSNKIVMGMLSGQDFNSILNVLKQVKTSYPNMGGTFVWEYYDAPENWDKRVSWAFYVSKLYYNFWYYVYTCMEWYLYLFGNKTSLYAMKKLDEYHAKQEINNKNKKNPE